MPYRPCPEAFSDLLRQSIRRDVLNVVERRFVQGIDYGPRKGTLGWNVHMAEGGDGTLNWLARRNGESARAWAKRVNGVSASFVILTNGEAVQMVGWDRAAGNLNPNDRSTDKAFYGRRHLLEVLGTHWTDPNAWTLSVELCGFRAKGPTRGQVETLVALIAESRKRFPEMVGAFGHADQTDTKGCPGTAELMLEIWRRVGHGRFVGGEEPDMPGLKVIAQGKVVAGVWRAHTDSDAIALHDRARDPIPVGGVRRALGTYFREPDNAPGVVTTEAGVPSWASLAAGDFTPDAGADCGEAVKAAVLADRLKARIVYEEN